MKNNTSNRWVYDLFVSPEDKPRIRAFVRNEIAYYNNLLEVFSSRARTMPDVLHELSDDLIVEIARSSTSPRGLRISDLPEGLKRFESMLFENAQTRVSERDLLVYDAVAKNIVLMPEVRAAMAKEMLGMHRKIADALSQMSGSDQQALRSPVETLTAHDGRMKRHVQLPQAGARVKPGTNEIYTVYNKNPLVVMGDIPKNWNLLVVREVDPGGRWNVEFRQEACEYLLKLTDAPPNYKRTTGSPAHRQQRTEF